MIGVLFGVLLASGCDEEDPCVQQLEDRTRALAESATLEELSQVVEADPNDLFGLDMALAIGCEEHGDCSAGSQYIRGALQEQLRCLEKQ